MNTLLFYHNRFFSFPTQLQDAISLCIEGLWKTDYPNKEQCIPAAITYLLLKSLQEDKSTSIFKRLYVDELY